MVFEFDWRGFREYLTNKQRYSEGSIDVYNNQAWLFSQVYDSTMSEEELHKLINDFCITRTNKKGETNRFKSTAMFGIRHFFMFIGREDLWKNYYDKSGQAIASKERPRRIINKVLLPEEIIEMKHNLPNPYDVIIGIQFETALRISEICNITPRDVSIVDTDPNNVFLRLSIIQKGGRQRIVPIFDKEIVDGVIELCSKNRTLNTQIFWDLNRMISQKEVNREYKVVAIKLFGEERGKLITSHWVRHSRAVQIYQETSDVFKTQLVLGHRRLNTTAVYLKSTGLLEEEVLKKHRIKW